MIDQRPYIEWGQRHFEKIRDCVGQPLEVLLFCAELSKQKGNAYFAVQLYLKAVEKYLRCIALFRHTLPAASEQRSERRFAEAQEYPRVFELIASTLLNLSAVYLHLENHYAAFSTAMESLSMNRRNPKAFYRLGLAVLGMPIPPTIPDNVLLAVMYFSEARALLPDDPSIAQALAQVKLRAVQLRQANPELFEARLRVITEQFPGVLHFCSLKGSFPLI